MATKLTTFLLFIQIWRISAQETSSDQAVPQKRPHLTGCVSTNMETFRCSWNVGTFQNLSEPGNLRLFYKNIIKTDNKWCECPHYTADPPHECFFPPNKTAPWKKYSVQLRSKDNTTTYDEAYFLINDIVRPDPPTGLNWTLLNVGLTGSHFDALVDWKPPESADVQTGWMTLQYEVQHRRVNHTRWTVADLEKTTQRSIYGLETNLSHEVRVRCKMLAKEHFGGFSKSIFITVPASRVTRFPVAILLVFAALCLVGILMLIVVSQQQKLMVILLPPVPGPKIRGIDPEMLRKGKLVELTSILGDHPDLRPELYNNDHWVEFIELDLEEPNDRLTDMDADCLADRSPSSDCSPLSIGFRDDDSGRASCCDPDMPCDAETLPFPPLLSNRRSSQDSSALAADPSSPVQNFASGQCPLAVGPGREELYTQVSEVKPSGEVLLAQEVDAADKDGKIKMETEKERLKKKEFQRVSTSASGYTSELDVGKMNARLSTVETNEPFHREDPGSASSQAFGDYQPPYHGSGVAFVPPLPPVYTVVEGVNTQNSLLLTPNLAPGPQLVVPKAMPTPEGYLTPDLLGNVTP